MQTLKQPYELLVRWERDGKLAGAHVQWRYVTQVDDQVVAEAISAAEPVAVAGQAGFPLCDVLSALQIESLAKVMPS